MRIIDKALQVTEDDWQLLDDDGDLPDDGGVIVSVARWQKEREALSAREGRLGLKIAGDTPLETIAPDLGRFALLALEFPKFVDGRCFSQARLLRGRYGYRGELRAVGDVVRDTIDFMRRCGIDSYALRPDKNAEDALEAFREFSVRYQGAADGAVPIYRQRR
ncbi:MAG: DUF934 domain-containing protein [Gammaproteobacteria bacterium]